MQGLPNHPTYRILDNDMLGSAISRDERWLSISSSSSFDNFTSPAFAFAMDCSAFLAPAKAMVIPGCSIVQRRTSWLSVTFLLSAMGLIFCRNWLVRLIFSS